MMVYNKKSAHQNQFSFKNIIETIKQETLCIFNMNEMQTIQNTMLQDIIKKRISIQKSKCWPSK